MPDIKWTDVAAGIGAGATAFILFAQQIAEALRLPKIDAAFIWRHYIDKTGKGQLALQVRPPASGAIFISRIDAPSGIEFAPVEYASGVGFGGDANQYAPPQWARSIEVNARIPMGAHDLSSGPVFWARCSASKWDKQKLATVRVWNTERRKPLMARKIEIPSAT